MPDIGYAALALTLAVTLYAATAAVVGARRGYPELIISARNGLIAAAGLTTLAALVLFYLLLARQFEVAYVYEHVSTHLPVLYTISAFWAGEEGSLLLWLWFLSLLTLGVVYSLSQRQKRKQDEQLRQELYPYIWAILGGIQGFIALILLFVHNPFQLLPVTPTEGAGLLPLLENPGMVLHPPTLFLGYAGAAVPFAFALAALLTGRVDRGWLRLARCWNLFAWLALGVGILIGAWWAYVELGWGGYWAWDPVENGSLIPWLVGTAFLHAAVVQERRSSFPRWTLLLATLTFVLCLFATFVTRAGVITSDLHGFSSRVQPITYYLLLFMGLSLGVPLYLVARREDRFPRTVEVNDLLSREAGFLAAMLLLCGTALAVFVGTVFPTVSQLLRGVRTALDTSFYNRAAGPLMVLTVFLMGICPVMLWQRREANPGNAIRLLRRLGGPGAGALLIVLVLAVSRVREAFALVGFGTSAFVLLSTLSDVGRTWLVRRRTTGESPLVALGRLLSRNRSRYGGYLVHLGIVCMAIGVTGSMVYQTERLVSLEPGETIHINDYTLRYEDYTIELVDADPPTYQSKERYAARLSVTKGGRTLAAMTAERNNHWLLDNPWVSEVSIHSTLREDLYVILASLDKTGLAAFQILVIPLVVWLWIGGGLMLIGTAIAMSGGCIGREK